MSSELSAVRMSMVVVLTAVASAINDAGVRAIITKASEEGVVVRETF